MCTFSSSSSSSLSPVTRPCSSSSSRPWSLRVRITESPASNAPASWVTFHKKEEVRSATVNKPLKVNEGTRERERVLQETRLCSSASESPSALTATTRSTHLPPDRHKTAPAKGLGGRQRSAVDRPARKLQLHHGSSRQGQTKYRHCRNYEQA